MKAGLLPLLTATLVAAGCITELAACGNGGTARLLHDEGSVSWGESRERVVFVQSCVEVLRVEVDLNANGSPPELSVDGVFRVIDPAGTEIMTFATSTNDADFEQDFPGVAGGNYTLRLDVEDAPVHPALSVAGSAKWWTEMHVTFNAD